RLGHLLPRAERGKPPFEQPFWLFFLGRDKADRVFVEARRGFIGLDIGHKAVFVALLRERTDRLKGIDGTGHAEYLGSSVSGGGARIGIRGTKAAGGILASSETAARG